MKLSHWLFKSKKKNEEIKTFCLNIYSLKDNIRKEINHQKVLEENFNLKKKMQNQCSNEREKLYEIEIEYLRGWNHIFK